jgi:hypothetical protein
MDNLETYWTTRHAVLDAAAKLYVSVNPLIASEDCAELNCQ